MCNAKKENGESIFTMTAVEGMTEYKQKKESGKPARKVKRNKAQEGALRWAGSELRRPPPIESSARGGQRGETAQEDARRSTVPLRVGEAGA